MNMNSKPNQKNNTKANKQASNRGRKSNKQASAAEQQVNTIFAEVPDESKGASSTQERPAPQTAVSSVVASASKVSAENVLKLQSYARMMLCMRKLKGIKSEHELGGSDVQSRFVEFLPTHRLLYYTLTSKLICRMSSLEGASLMDDSHPSSVLPQEITRTSPTPTPQSNTETSSSAQPILVRKPKIIEVMDMSKLSCLSRCRNENDDLTFSSFGRVAVVDYSTTTTIDLTHEEEPGHNCPDDQTDESLLTLRDVSTRLPQDVKKSLTTAVVSFESLNELFLAFSEVASNYFVHFFRSII